MAQARLAEISQSGPTNRLAFTFQGQQKIISIPNSATVGQLLRQLRRDYQISRFTWLEYRANGRAIPGNRHCLQSQIGSLAEIEIVCCHSANCF